MNDVILDEMSSAAAQEAIARYAARVAQRVTYVISNRPDVCPRTLPRELTPREYGAKLLNRNRKKR